MDTMYTAQGDYIDKSSTAMANAQESTELINRTERLSGKWHLLHTATVDNMMNNSLNTHIHAELN